MTARAISIEAYDKHHASGKALTQWMKIYDYLRLVDGLTRNEIAAQTQIPITSVCGRVKELLDAGMVYEGPRRVCNVTGSEAHPVSVTREWRKAA